MCPTKEKLKFIRRLGRLKSKVKFTGEGNMGYFLWYVMSTGASEDVEEYLATWEAMSESERLPYITFAQDMMASVWWNTLHNQPEHTILTRAQFRQARDEWQQATDKGEDLDDYKLQTFRLAQSAFRAWATMDKRQQLFGEAHPKISLPSLNAAFEIAEKLFSSDFTSELRQGDNKTSYMFSSKYFDRIYNEYKARASAELENPTSPYNIQFFKREMELKAIGEGILSSVIKAEERNNKTEKTTKDQIIRAQKRWEEMSKVERNLALKRMGGLIPSSRTAEAQDCYMKGYEKVTEIVFTSLPQVRSLFRKVFERHPIEKVLGRILRFIDDEDKLTQQILEWLSRSGPLKNIAIGITEDSLFELFTSLSQRNTTTKKDYEEAKISFYGLPNDKRNTLEMEISKQLQSSRTEPMLS
ncbi:hypothetical protein AAMO2058_001492900 [Amorphochlora amoebiformis]